MQEVPDFPCKWCMIFFTEYNHLVSYKCLVFTTIARIFFLKFDAHFKYFVLYQDFHKYRRILYYDGQVRWEFFGPSRFDLPTQPISTSQTTLVCYMMHQWIKSWHAEIIVFLWSGAMCADERSIEWNWRGSIGW